MIKLSKSNQSNQLSNRIQNNWHDSLGLAKIDPKNYAKRRIWIEDKIVKVEDNSGS